MTKMKVAVTGASGYIGAHVTKALLAAGHEVRATVRDAADFRKTAHLRALAASDRLTLFSADLLDERSFDRAFAGCDWLCHVASPVTFNPKDPLSDMIEPAVKGTLNVLNAAKRSGSVGRVVLTSSVAAVVGSVEPTDVIYTDQDWNKTSTVCHSAYSLSKTLAERAAWDFVREEGLELVTILPGYVFGPILCREHARTSITWVDRMLRGKLPMYPHINLAQVDVEDVALAHLSALERSEAHGRYILVNDNHWVSEIAAVIRERFPDAPVPKWRAPNIAVYLIALLDKDVTLHFMRHALGRTVRYDNERTQRELGIEFKPFEQSIVETVESIRALKVY